MTEHEAYVALNLVPSMGGETARAGIARFGSAAAFLARGAADLVGLPGVGRVRAAAFADAFATVPWRAEIERAAKAAVRLVTPADPEWPAALSSIHCPPLALYVAGDPAALSATPCLAVVGTRAPTPYGSENARTFSYRLAQAGVTIVSGLARGVDTAAAEGALLARGRTIAVIGAALDRLYPPENRGLARRIVAAGGAVVSEYPFGRSADRQTFPMRNRLVSGLCAGTLCIEAGLTSGTLITADHAMEQGRSVMAIPGRICDPTALGCLKLLRDGARLVASPEDVLDELSSLPLLPGGRPARAHPEGAPRAAAPSAPAPASAPPAPAAPASDPEERRILDAIRSADGLTPDGVVAATGLPAHRVGPMLIALEMKGAVRRAPDGTCSIRRPR